MKVSELINAPKEQRVKFATETDNVRVLEILFHDKEMEVRKAIAGNKVATKVMLETLAKDSSFAVRMTAQNAIRDLFG